MTDTFKQQLIAVKSKYEETKVSTTVIRKSLADDIAQLGKYTGRYEDSWSGDWVENVDIYHKDFDIATLDRIRVDEKLIKQNLTQLSGISLDELKNKLPALSENFFALRDFIITELSFIKDIDVYKNETEVLQKIEEFKWGVDGSYYVQARRPKYLFGYDPTIINRGFQIPPHISVLGDIISTFSVLQAYDNFEKEAYRLVRQLEIKSSTTIEEGTGSIFQQQAVRTIIEKFHTVATQLKNRYNSRSTLCIDDEYDVQDLINAMLHINFEDVRKEEFTPSYAGSSTRIDFLLKREQILIEVKKTRATLKDRQIGEELLIDIAHYGSHPDCKHLICFVYDPENLIANPRGLEDDLNRYSSEEMIVEVYVRP